MGMYKYGYYAIIFLLIFSFLMIVPFNRYVTAKVVFTQEEQAFLANNKPIKAAAVRGSAPLLDADSSGEAVGIFKEILDIITDMTGLNFEITLYDSIEESLNSDSDIFIGMDPVYAGNTTLSHPFLASETVLFMNSQVDAENLDHKIYAVVEGAILSDDVQEEHIMYFGTREQTLDAVESGKADYGHGNAFSVAFYTLKNGYRNIITVPIAQQKRQYSIGLLKPNDILLSIINKAIDNIDPYQTQMIILDIASKVEPKVTISMIFSTYSYQIASIIALIIIVLSIGVFFSVRTAKKLALQNNKYEMLTIISNEYLYEYNYATGKLMLSDKLRQSLDAHQHVDKIEEELKTMLLQEQSTKEYLPIKLVIANDQTIVFQPISSTIYNSNGQAHSVIGKLVDISVETAEKAELLSKSQMDGLTKLYNAVTAKKLITKRLENIPKGDTDAFLLLDLDKLKQINDNFGHLTGNKVIKQLSSSLNTNFRKTDIIGRIGGDEFCIYMQDIPSVNFIRSKCEDVNKYMEKTFPNIPTSASIGVALVTEPSDWETVFDKADKALYQAKSEGLGNVVVDGGDA